MAVETPVILSAVRTPIGKFQGGLAGFSAPELGGKIVAEAIRRAGLDSNKWTKRFSATWCKPASARIPRDRPRLKGDVTRGLRR
jgi:acetyl-CoA acetyltransferase